MHLTCRQIPDISLHAAVTLADRGSFMPACRCKSCSATMDIGTSR